MKYRIFFTATLWAALSGCASTEVFQGYPGALSNGKPITIAPYHLEGKSKFCVWGLAVRVDDMPYAANPYAQDKPRCASKVTSDGRHYTESPGSFFPLLDYKAVTVSFSRSLGGPVEVHILNIEGKMLANPPPKGAQVSTLYVTITEKGVRASRADNGPAYRNESVIAATGGEQ